jgi:Zn-dependent peptidase ImmA (M78 family)
MLLDHPDISLCITRLPEGERGRWYPRQHVIVLNESLTQAERRCTLMHELVHRMRGDTHVEDNVTASRQEKSCHDSAARLLISFAALRAAMQWGRDPQELADELWVDVETLEARVRGLSESESAVIAAQVSGGEWSVA